jgi:arylsulfatase A-like enzyme
MNIIVLLSDTFRYDYLGCNGNSWIGTDELDRFAQRAVCFEQHYLSSFPTIPNRTDLFTGRFSFPFHGWQPLERDIPVLSTLFGQAGYQSQLIAAPGLKGGQRVQELTQSVDLLPTFVDLARIKGEKPAMHGHSLAPLLQGSAKSWQRDYAFSSTFIRNGGPTVTDKRWTYMAHGEKNGKPELYDMKADPGQKRNVVRQYPGVARRMEKALFKFLEEVGTPEENYTLIGPVGGPDYADRVR